MFRIQNVLKVFVLNIRYFNFDIVECFDIRI
jgi:hypothetical protein